jgi:hypothetical protein
LADDPSRAGTRDAEAGPNEIGPDVFAIRNRRISRRSTKGEYPVKWIKNLALAAIAAAAFMAVIGAGTASATQLCSLVKPASEPTECSGAAGKWEYSGKITGTSTNATLATNLANVECSDSHTMITAFASTGETIFGEVDELTFTGCRTEITLIPCTVTVRNLPYNASVAGKTLTVTDAVGAGAKVVCGTVLSCEFLTKEAALAITNGSPTVAVAEKVALSHESGTACPSTATWSATYKVISPEGLTVL